MVDAALALRTMLEPGTVEEVCAAKDKEVPERLDEIRQLFLSHPAGDEPLPAAGMADEGRLRELLQEGHQFSERRIQRALDRLAGVGRVRQAGQTSLLDF